MGTTVKLPPYLCPFAVFTESEMMILWAANASQRDMWVQGFNSLMLSTPQADIVKFKPVKTRKNAFVFNFYQLLSSGVGKGKNKRLVPRGSCPTEVGQKRARTLVPTSRAMKP